MTGKRILKEGGGNENPFPGPRKERSWIKRITGGGNRKGPPFKRQGRMGMQTGVIPRSG